MFYYHYTQVNEGAGPALAALGITLERKMSIMIMPNAANAGPAPSSLLELVWV
jgi:hypothetical protein